MWNPAQCRGHDRGNVGGLVCQTVPMSLLPRAKLRSWGLSIENDMGSLTEALHPPAGSVVDMSLGMGNWVLVMDSLRGEKSLSPASNLVCLGLCLKDWYFAPVEETRISISSRSIDCKQNQSKYLDVRSDDEGPRSAKDMKFSQQSNEGVPRCSRRGWVRAPPAPAG